LLCCVLKDSKVLPEPCGPIRRCWSLSS